MTKRTILPAGGEFGLVTLIISIVSLIIFPLPTTMIDILISINISLSVTLLMATIYVPNIVSLSAFPSLLLFTTLFRLSLNIASTKSILLHADAGQIIESFGRLVVGGNLVVGLVVFLIITTVQFIVIAKGSERVAEVSARFTLDALPGKQMSIDADLRANLITGEEAKRKREIISIESQLHGGMDGAMKFVKGDAVAGLIITMVNIVAGIAVGAIYRSMTIGDAANRFSVLSIGDAMVSQIPSLLLSVAAGIMITRVSDEREIGFGSLGDEIGRQLGSSTRALYFTSALLLGFALVPGFPWELFILLSFAIAFTAFRIDSRRKSTQFEHDSESLRSMQRSGAKANVPAILSKAPQFTCPVGVRISPDLAAQITMPLLDQSCSVERTRLQDKLGLPFPGITMWVHVALEPATCEILLYDVPQQMIEFAPGNVMLPIDPHIRNGQIQPADETLTTLRAASGQSVNSDSMSTQWLDEGAVCIDTEVWCTERIIAHAAISQMRQHASQFLGIQEVQWILDQLATDYPGLVSEVQKTLPLQRIAEVLRRLLDEQISIRNARGIMESLIIWGAKEKDPLMLTEYVRCDLSRFIAYHAAQGQKQLVAVLFDMSAEQYIRQAIKQTPTGNFLALPPEETAAIVEKVAAIANSASGRGVVLVTSMDIRRYVRRIIENQLSWLAVYSYQELDEHVELLPLGRVTI